MQPPTNAGVALSDPETRLSVATHGSDRLRPRPLRAIDINLLCDRGQKDNFNFITMKSIKSFGSVNRVLGTSRRQANREMHFIPVCASIPVY